MKKNEFQTRFLFSKRRNCQQILKNSSIRWKQKNKKTLKKIVEWKEVRNTKIFDHKFVHFFKS